MQRECGLGDTDSCIRRFRQLYAGKQSYSDQALRLQFDTMRDDTTKASDAVVGPSATGAHDSRAYQWRRRPA